MVYGQNIVVETEGGRPTVADTGQMVFSKDTGKTFVFKDGAWSEIGASGEGGPHTHPISEVTNLQTGLDGKASSGHNHDASYAAIAHSHTIGDLPTGTTGSTVAVGNHTHAGSSYRTLVTLGSDVVNNNAIANTIADVTGLSFPVTNGTITRFVFTIIYNAAATATGSRWSINGPAFTLLGYSSRYSLTATSQTTNYANAYNIPAASNATSANTTGNIAIIEGIINPSANGTVIARFASEVLNSAITAKAGSTVEYW